MEWLVTPDWDDRDDDFDDPYFPPEWDFSYSVEGNKILQERKLKNMPMPQPANKVTLAQRRKWRRRFDPILDQGIRFEEELAVAIYQARQEGLTLHLVGDLAGGMANETIHKYYARGEALLKERAER